MGEQLAPPMYLPRALYLNVMKTTTNNKARIQSYTAPFQWQGLILPFLNLPFVLSLTSQILYSDQESTALSLCDFRILQLIMNR